jgi:hypothetical protein
MLRSETSLELQKESDERASQYLRELQVISIRNKSLKLQVYEYSLL